MTYVAQLPHLVPSCQDALGVVHRTSATDAGKWVAQTLQVVTRALNCKGQAEGINHWQRQLRVCLTRIQELPWSHHMIMMYAREQAAAGTRKIFPKNWPTATGQCRALKTERSCRSRQSHLP
jgi:hypothetical protein